MLRSVLLCVVALAVAGFQLSAGEKGKKEEKIKWDKTAFEKSLETDFDLKVKSWTMGEEGYPEEGDKKARCIKLLLEFTKDVDPNVYQSRGLPFGNSRKGGGADKPYVEFYYFDDENVRLRSERNSFDRIDGEVTLKKGEAFRVYIFDTADEKLLARTKRIEVYIQIPKKKRG